jgi:hypothetical protein
MGLSSRTILDIIELVYYGPALVATLWVVKKHGLGRQSGWIYLAILALLRIVGAATGIAANYHPSQGLYETSTITDSIKRVNEGMHAHSFPPKFISLVHLPILVGLVLAISGGTKLFDTNPASVNTGVTYTKAAIMLLLVSLIALSVISIFTFMQIQHIMAGEKRLVFASLAVIPFLVVRIIYSIVVDFDRSSTLFSLISDRNAAVVIQAIMSVAMEFAVVSIFLIAGFATPVIPRSMVQSQHHESAPAQQPMQQYGGLASRDDPPMTSYPLTVATPSYKGHHQGQEYGMTDGVSSPNRV